MGSYQGEFDLGDIWKEITGLLLDMKIDKYADEDEKLYTLDEIEVAVDNTDFESLASKFIEDSDIYNSVEIDVEGRDRGDGVLDVSASASFDDDNIQIDEEAIVDEIIGNL
jgi:hypothetical protein